MSLRNSIDFFLRQRLTWSPAARERSEDPEPFADDTDRRWTEDYGLEAARRRMAGWRWRRNLAVLQLLDRAAAEPLFREALAGGDPLRALDIGSKNFDYVDALAAVLSHGGRRTVDLTGLEIDPHRRYTDLRTRRAWAEHYCSFVPGARYLPGDLEDHEGSYRVITWFFPFLFRAPLVKWGLPGRLLRPAALLARARALLEPGGVLLIVNLTADEEAEQHRLLGEAGAAFTPVGPVPGRYSPRSADQRLTLVPGSP